MVQVKAFRSDIKWELINDRVYYWVTSSSLVTLYRLCRNAFIVMRFRRKGKFNDNTGQHI